jgi:hypothetical protein
MSCYDGFEDFYNLDIRKDRVVSPVVMEHKIKKYSGILPEELVKDKNILEIGSCMGDAGHWCLSHGAKQYTGVEIQEEFYKKSKKLLSHWGDKAINVNMDLETYLNTLNNFKFDLTIFFGVLYAFPNPVDILEKVFNSSNKTVVIDSMTPIMILNKKLIEYPMVEHIDRPMIISQEGQLSYSGFSNYPSKTYVEKVGNVKGFSSIELPIVGENYDGEILSNTDEIPVRYFSRFDKTHDEVLTLQERIKTNDISELSDLHFNKTNMQEVMKVAADNLKKIKGV